MTSSVALVTGANGMIGRAVSTALRAAGHVVVGVDLAAAPVDAGPYVQADLSDVNGLPGLIERIEREWGVVRVLVNNAGIWLGKGFFDITPSETI